MKDLKTIVETIVTKEVESSRSLENIDPRLLQQVEGSIRASKMALEDAIREYKQELPRHVLAIAVTGNQAEEFANVAKYAHNIITVDFKEPAKQIIKSIKDRGMGPSFTNQEYFVLLSELNQMKVNFGIHNLPVPQLNSAVDRVMMFPIDEAVETLLEKNYGSTLYLLNAKYRATEAALAKKYSGKNLPMVIYNFDNSLVSQEGILNVSELIDINDEKDVNNFVKATFASIKGKIARKTRTDKEREGSNE